MLNLGVDFRLRGSEWKQLCLSGIASWPKPLIGPRICSKRLVRSVVMDPTLACAVELASVRGKEHNQGVRTRAPRTVGAIAVLIGTSLAAGALADLASSATAMACCAKAKYECAGLRAPDDCCHGMGHAPARTLAGTLSSAQSPEFASADVVSWSPVDLALSVPWDAAPVLKRPHDPPHLHRYHPLI